MSRATRGNSPGLTYPGATVSFLPHTRAVDPLWWDHDLTRDRRDPAFVLRELGHDEIDGGGGKVVAALVDPGAGGHGGRPVVDDKTNVLGHP